MRNTLLGAFLVALGALSRPLTAWADAPDSAPPPVPAPVSGRPPYGDEAEADRTPALRDIDDPLGLRRTPRLNLGPATDDSKQLPVFLRGDAVEGFTSAEITATGNAELRQRGITVLADELRYLVPDERCSATGNVVVLRGGDVLTGPSATFNLKDDTGGVVEPEIHMAKGLGRRYEARLNADQVTFQDQDHEHLDEAAFTTCLVDPPDWTLTGKSMDLDQGTEIGVAYNAYIEFKGVPLLYAPYMSFPLNDQRKSGFLSPTIGTTGTNGLDVALPYYFNIAPNLDDTLTGRFMSKRGDQLQNEFRYLEPTMTGPGILQLEYLQHDISTGTDRYYFSWKHEQNLPYGFHFHADAQDVSDSNYFRDLSTLVTATSTTYANRDFSLSKGLRNWQFSIHTYDPQTIQNLDPAVNGYVLDQYRMLPQITANYSQRIDGFAVSLQNEYVNFRNASLVDGQRLVSYPSIALPIVRDWGYVTPKIGYHFTDYEDAAQVTSVYPGQAFSYPAIGSQHLTRGLPIGSLDAGLFFEREIQFDDRSVVQTLEPRLYYLNIPYRYQDNLPIFNTGIADVSYSQLFSENHYSGPDRINDANQLTAAVQSRLLDPVTGVELIRAVVGERFYFRRQSVVLQSTYLPGPIATEETARDANLSDLILGVTGRLADTMQGEFSSDFNPSTHQTEKFVAAWHWRPELGKSLNLAYRIDSTALPDVRQIDISTEWPIADRWRMVGRVNYDTAQTELVEGLAGLEYTSGCWVFRIVAHRLAVSTTQTSSSIFFQLELNGLAGLGTNPLEILRQNIPGYVKSNEIPQ